MFDVDGNFGMVPIECPYGSPACGGDLQFNWGSPFTLPGNTVPNAFYGTTLGGTDPIVISTINTAAGVNTPATPPQLSTSTPPSPEQIIAGVNNSTLLLAAGGIVAALVLLSD